MRMDPLGYNWHAGFLADRANAGLETRSLGCCLGWSIGRSTVLDGSTMRTSRRGHWRATRDAVRETGIKLGLRLRTMTFIGTRVEAENMGFGIDRSRACVSR